MACSLSLEACEGLSTEDCQLSQGILFFVSPACRAVVTEEDATDVGKLGASNLGIAWAALPEWGYEYLPDIYDGRIPL